MKISGNIQKMHTALEPQVQYQLPMGDQLIDMNALLGQNLRFSFSGQIHCIACGRRTNKSFNQGHCYPCFQKLASCDRCIMSPELCHYTEGSCREPEWGEQFCFQDHYVYLANSSGVKVGITRGTQIPTRWMDQGAVQALPIFKVKDRLTSGKIEVIIKQHVTDKTSWQRMLKGEPDKVDLAEKRDELIALCRDELNILQKEIGEDAMELLDTAEAININFPVNEYPIKVKSFNFDKTPRVEGRLMGIKGQYLILDTGVLNMRKFAGYELELETAL